MRYVSLTSFLGYPQAFSQSLHFFNYFLDRNKRCGASCIIIHISLVKQEKSHQHSKKNGSLISRNQTGNLAHDFVHQKINCLDVTLPRFFGKILISIKKISVKAPRRATILPPLLFLISYILEISSPILSQDN